MDHAFIPPSQLPVICKCSGSLLMQSAAPPEADLQAAREGTAAHYVVDQRLRSFATSDANTIIRQDLVGKMAPNDVTIVDEMWDAADVMVQDVMQVCTQFGLLSQLHLEERTDPIPEIHEACWGTPDCWTFSIAKRTLWLWDFKYGHSPVVPYENEQLIAYGLDALRKVTAGQPLGDHGITVVFRIVQPRCYDGLGAVREWSVPAVNLRANVNWIRDRVAQAIEPTAQCETGPHCRKCDATSICPALRDASATVADVIASASVEPPDDAQLAYELSVVQRATDLLKARREALEAVMEHRLRNGTAIPGWTMQVGKGRRQWNDTDEEVIAMGDLLGIDLRENVKPCSPATADKRMKAAGFDESVISAYYHSPPGAMKLVHDDGSLARQLFKRTTK